MLPIKDLINDNGNQLDDSSNLKPNVFTHQGGTECEQEHVDRLNKDIKERHSNASSDRWHDPRRLRRCMIMMTGVS